MHPYRQTPACRALLILLSALLSFAAVQLILGILVEHGPPGVRDPDYAQKVEHVQARRREGSDQTLVLVLGSLRVEMGLDAARISTFTPSGQRLLVFNFGLTGSASLLEALCLRRWRRRGPPTRPADPGGAAGDPEPARRPSCRRRLDRGSASPRQRGGVPAALSQPAGTVAAALGSGRSLPCWWQHGDLCQGLGLDPVDLPARPEPLLGPMDNHGWRPFLYETVTPSQRRRHRDFTRRQYTATLGPFHLAAGPAQALQETIARCRQEEIPLALLLMPEAPSFRALYPLPVQKELDDHLVRLAQAWQVPLMDARGWQEEDDFWDGHHLLPRGARAFSERFLREFPFPLLRQATKQ